MKDILFIITLLSDLVLIMGLGISIFKPSHRIWPPPRRASWQYWASWFFVTVASVGVPIIGLVDWDNWWLSGEIRFPIAIGLFAVSGMVIYKSIKALSIHQSLGLKGALVETGPYRYVIHAIRSISV